ncbi:hypothetical protein F0562_015468 [Nyssa sinensis]|uniref:Protein kinase domain-containing protein n=1 Tax=Nyssa sinensis TaxID=561372 RepID=A0A5J4ZJL1_9ASTE|nr:hypothetical protein F0562_015468 [Nyssa sinensis]
MTAHVGDFGLARFLFDASNNPSKIQTISAGLKGSFGYIPPEYGMGGQVSTFGDVYSYGILLLEMFTGKRPTDDIFKEGLSIQKFVAMALPEHVGDIVDLSLLFVEEDDVDEKEVEERAIIHDHDHQRICTSRMKECLVSVMRIGLSCCSSIPRERMAMNVIVNKMHSVRDSFL